MPKAQPGCGDTLRMETGRAPLLVDVELGTREDRLEIEKGVKGIEERCEGAKASQDHSSEPEGLCNSLSKSRGNPQSRGTRWCLS